MRRALVITPEVELAKGGKRLQTGRDEDRCKQAGRATATLEIDRGKHDVGLQWVRGATRNREANPGFLLSLPWRAHKVPTNMGERQQEH